MTIRIIKSRSIDYVDNHKEVAHHVNELTKIKLQIEEVAGRKKELLKEINDLELSRNQLIEERKKASERLLQESEDRGRSIEDKARLEAESLLAEAKKQAEEIKRTTQDEKNQVLQIAAKEKETILEDFEKKGYQEGFEKGFDLGKGEREKISELLKKMLQEVSLKRDEMVNHFEGHLIDIALLITRRVVKSLTDSQKGIVVKNLVHALKQLKGAIKVKVHLNHEDLAVVNQFKRNILSAFKPLQKVEIVEDPTVGRGGCVVESGYSVIDAKIATQLSKIEEAIREQNPVKMH